MPHTITRLSVVILVAGGVLGGCTLLGPTASDPSVEMIFCAEEIGRYRTGAGLLTLQRSAALESYAAESASVDGTANRAHLHFTQTHGGGVALAETELLSWRTPDVHAVVKQGLQVMWDEGPAGEHRVILNGPYSEVGCGVFIGDTGVTVVQSFR